MKIEYWIEKIPSDTTDSKPAQEKLHLVADGNRREVEWLDDRLKKLLTSRRQNK